MADRLATSFDDSAHSPGLALWRVTLAWQAAMRAAVEPFELTHVQFVLLASLSWLRADGPVTQRRLADHAGTDPMMTSQVVRALEAKGLVERRDHPTDRRARALVISARGVELADAAVVAVESADAAFFAPLPDGAAHFTAELRRLMA